MNDLGQYEEAMENFDVAIRYNSSYPEAYYNKGIALLNLGDIHCAIKNCDMLLDTDQIIQKHIIIKV
ncbi:tetratricopeptide repeat protein [Orientia tsutsugamushi]|uniref:TPR repeat family protein n=1 Tax=Orientia tsutsugamushi str. TA716 TaxID=1359175 RepID=A0A0F3P526_ORITS|nr:tetratricopeptide repeat protein [Orientia tsutsugamushi]KJV70338.1 TPR repeat family protein [Orientia tsutsugamushi str. TA716]KJV75440.1 TPR repeat family protein [Orientia tsutsugamushi str. TA716]